MARRKQVCRNCRRFTTEKVCPTCKSTGLSTSWKGMVAIINSDSEISRMLQIQQEGKYAIYVS